MSILAALRLSAVRAAAHLGVRSERGAAMVEYAVIVFIIVVFCITAMAFLADATKEKYDCAASVMSTRSGDC